MVYKVVDSGEKVLSKAVSGISPIVAHYTKDGAGLEYAIGELQHNGEGFPVLENFDGYDDPVLISLLYLHVLDPKYLGSGIKSKGRRKLLKAAVPLSAIMYCGGRVLNGAVTGNSGEVSKYLAYLLGFGAMGYRNLEDEFRNLRGYQGEEFFHERAKSFLEELIGFSSNDDVPRFDVVDRESEIRKQKKALGISLEPYKAKRPKRKTKTKK